MKTVAARTATPAKPLPSTQLRADNAITVVYRCTNCGAIDRPRLFHHEQIPPAINCWNCHAGQGKSVGQMLEQDSGMLLIVDEDLKTEILKSTVQ